MQQKDGVRPSPRLGTRPGLRQSAGPGDPARGHRRERGLERRDLGMGRRRRGVDAPRARAGAVALGSRHGLRRQHRSGDAVRRGAPRIRTLGDGELLDVWLYDPTTDRWVESHLSAAGHLAAGPPRPHHGLRPQPQADRHVRRRAGEPGHRRRPTCGNGTACIVAWRERTAGPLPTGTGPAALVRLPGLHRGRADGADRAPRARASCAGLATPNEWFNIVQRHARRRLSRRRACGRWSPGICRVNAAVAVGGPVMLGPELLTDTWLWRP